MKAPNLPLTLQAQAALAAVGALARIAALRLGREDVRTQQLVQRVQHVADAQILDLLDGGMKSLQKSRSTSFHSSLPSEMRSSFSSRSAVKSYST